MPRSPCHSGKKTFHHRLLSNESAKSRIADADFAREQMEIAKLQILQQTGINALVNSNLAPQAILSLLQ